MGTRVVRTSMRLRRREPQLTTDVNGTEVAEQAPVVEAPIVFTPPMIEIEDEDDDDDVVISTASAFAQAKNNSSGTRRAPRVVVDVDAGMNAGTSTARPSKGRTKRSAARVSVKSDKVNESKKSKAVAAAVEELKFSCPICMCPFDKETSTKCGHIFCKGCIKKAISHQANCPTCRKKVVAKDLIRIFLPSTR